MCDQTPSSETQSIMDAPESTRNPSVLAALYSLANWIAELESALRHIEDRLDLVLKKKQPVDESEIPDETPTPEVCVLAHEIHIRSDQVQAICQNIASIAERIEL